LTLTLSVHINNDKIYNGTQIRVGFQHLEILTRFRIFISLKFDQLRVTIRGSNENNAII
jgi:hypothetical protein